MIDIKIYTELKNLKDTFTLDVDFKVNQGDFISIYGNSGTGKTTLIKTISGLIQPEKGKIVIEGNTWYDSQKSINVKPNKRRIGFVFQDTALFPNMTVRQNLKYALEKGKSESVIDELIEIIELADIQDRNPDTLSGGQKQRVGLARALVRQPDILVLDEPLSALDDTMRQKLQNYLLLVHKKFNLTTFLVSHDLGEIFKLSNQIIKLENGKIIAQGKPEEVFLNHKISGKYKSVGQILSITKSDIVYILNILVDNSIVKVVASEKEAKLLSIGDQVMIVSKAFNPILIKI